MYSKEISKAKELSDLMLKIDIFRQKCDYYKNQIEKNNKLFYEYRDKLKYHSIQSDVYWDKMMEIFNNFFVWLFDKFFLHKMKEYKKEYWNHRNQEDFYLKKMQRIAKCDDIYLNRWKDVIRRNSDD